MSDVMADFVKEKMYEVARRLIRLGEISLPAIAEATGLTLEEVEELAKKKTA